MGRWQAGEPGYPGMRTRDSLGPFLSGGKPTYFGLPWASEVMRRIHLPPHIRMDTHAHLLPLHKVTLNVHIQDQSSQHIQADLLQQSSHERQHCSLCQFRYSDRLGCTELWVSKDTKDSRMLWEDAGGTLLAVSGTGTGGGGGVL